MTRLLTLHNPRAARANYADGRWRDDTFYTLLAGHAAARPEAWAARDSNRRLTWRQFQSWVDAVAADFAQVGIAQGERVGLWLSNRLEALVAFIACSRNGYVCNPSLHRNYTVAEIVALAGRIDARIMVIEDGWGTDADENDPAAALAALGSVIKIVRLPRARGLGADLPGPNSPQGRGAPVDDNPDKVTYLAFTSGTTGTPKGVMHSDNTLLANCRDLVADWGHDHAGVLLTLSPLSHHIAWVALGQALTAGMELVVDDPPEGSSRLDWISATGATYVMGVPTHAMDILAEQRRRRIARLGDVKLFYMAGAPIPPSVAQAFLSQGIAPQNVYGMTENSSHQYTHPDDDADTVCATCGRGGRAYEIRIFDQEDPNRPVPAGVAGQIGGRGAALMLGYFDNQAATEASFNRDGWFLSGDLGVVDQRGNLKIVGRLKDVVIRGGHNIHPAKVEDLAVKHPDIAKAAAFGIADERLGEKLCLAITRAGATSPAPPAVLRHLFDAGLSRYDMPEYFLVLDDFPLTASGKILKRELAEWARNGRIVPQPCRFRPDEREGS